MVATSRAAAAGTFLAMQRCNVATNDKRVRGVVVGDSDVRSVVGVHKCMSRGSSASASDVSVW
jgi:hypothetical protein